MVSLRHISVLVGIVLSWAAALPVIDERASQVIPDKYIVTLKPGVSISQVATHLNWVRTVHSRSSSRRDVAGVEKVYSIEDFNAYAGSFDAATIDQIRRSDQVAAVEPDMVWRLNQKGRSLVTQSGAPWGLGSISHRAPNFSDYIYNPAAGQGTYAYVIDTGLSTSHVEFEGRAQLGYNAVPNTKFVDNLGHGTHVAGTIGSRAYGVAKKATLISVKVFDDVFQSSTSIVLDGFNWAVNNITASNRADVSVVCLSLEGKTSDAFNLAIRKAFEAGVLSVAAAGNEGVDASMASPGSAPEAITVGAVDSSDARPSWSNYGSLVDIFAPGVAVTSCWIGGANDAVASMDGTSMAAPHVAGLVLYLKSIDRSSYSTAASVSARLTGLGTPGIVQDPGVGSPNLLAYNGNGA